MPHPIREETCGYYYARLETDCTVQLRTWGKWISRIHLLIRYSL